MNWFYQKDFQPVGPCSEEEIRRLVKEGKLGELSPVWRSGMPEWVALMNTPLAFHLVDTEPSPSLTDVPAAPAPSSPRATVNQIGADRSRTRIDPHSADVERADPLLTADGPGRLATAGRITLIAFLIVLVSVALIQFGFADDMRFDAALALLPVVWGLLFICWSFAHVVMWNGISALYRQNSPHLMAFLLLIPVLNFLILAASTGTMVKLVEENGTLNARMKVAGMRRLGGVLAIVIITNLVVALIATFLFDPDFLPSADPDIPFVHLPMISLWGAVLQAFLIMRLYATTRRLLVREAGLDEHGSSEERQREYRSPRRDELNADRHSPQASIQYLTPNEQRYERDRAGRDSQGYIKKY